MLLAPGLFLKAWVEHQEHQFHKSVRRVLTHGVDRAQLSRIAVPIRSAPEMDWIHHKEFRYRGSMFDVVHREYRSDSAIYWCWWDAEENRLMSQLDRLVNGLSASDPMRDKLDERWMHFIKGFWVDGHEKQTLEDGRDDVRKPCWNDLQKAGYSENSSPPPELDPLCPEAVFA